MKNSFIALVVLVLFGLSAQASFEQYAGSYSGKFQNNKGTLVISVSGGVMSATFVGENNSSSDILGNCASSIGKMLKMDIDDGTEVDHVTFAFNPGNCGKKIEGREINVNFKHKDGKVVGAHAAVFSHTTSSYSCTGSGEDKTCDWVDYDRYLMGKFKRCAFPMCGG
jgi:hypothetical protein